MQESSIEIVCKAMREVAFFSFASLIAEIQESCKTSCLDSIAKHFNILSTYADKKIFAEGQILYRTRIVIFTELSHTNNVVSCCVLLH